MRSSGKSVGSECVWRVWTLPRAIYSPGSLLSTVSVKTFELVVFQSDLLHHVHEDCASLVVRGLYLHDCRFRV